MRELTQKQAEALKLRRELHLGYRRIAKRMGMSPGSVYRAILAAELKEQRRAEYEAARSA